MEVVHDAVAGRVRFRVDGLRSRPDLCADLERALRGSREVDFATVSARTGSILIVHDLTVPRDSLELRLRDLLGSAVPAHAESLPVAHEHAIRGLWAAIAGIGTEAGTVEARPEAPYPFRDWHTMAAPEVVLELDSCADRGLPRGEIAGRLEQYGPNRIPVAPPPSGVAIFLKQFTSVPVWLLLGSSVLSIATGGFADAVAIVAVVVMNAGIGTFTELRSESAISALPRLELPSTPVVRDGEVTLVPAVELVPGDVMLLSRGMPVPADGRLLEVEQLTVDESALTGESMPAAKLTGSLESSSIPLADRRNLVFRGTVITGGSGFAVVVASGPFTEVGIIQGLAESAVKRKTPIERDLERLGRQLATAAGAASGLVFVLGVARGHPALEIFKMVVSLAVASIPEGLPTVATTTLAFGVRRLGRQGVLIRRLEVAEALGALEVLCLDKTGTMTMNRMQAVSVRAGGVRYHVGDGDGVLDSEAPLDPAPSPDLVRLFEICALNSEAELAVDPSTEAVGTPTEVALLELAHRHDVDVASLRARYPRRIVEERSEGRMYMRTEHDTGAGGSLRTVKGRPDQVLALCSHWAVDGGVRPLGPGDREAIERENDHLGSAALRVLGFAWELVDGDAQEHPGREEEAGLEEPTDERSGRDRPSEATMVWAGLVGIEDPVRPGARDLVQRCRAAGIRTVLITGDQSATAYAVARRLGLSTDGELEIIDSTRLEDVEPTVLAEMARRAHVFSRVSPVQKLLIVEALQQRGYVVGMTGDGINDGPALRQADVGIAVRTEGGEVAQEIADVVLAEGDLQGMLDAVAQGRTLADDIGKSVRFIAATNVSEVVFTLASVGSGLGAPLNPKQLLWLNLLSDVFPELALSVEPPEQDVLARPPRDPKSSILSPEVRRQIAIESGVITASVLVAYGWGVGRYGPGPRAGTLAFTTMTVSQLLHTVTTRSQHRSLFGPHRAPSNPWVSWAIGTGFGLQLLAVGVGGFRRLLGNAPVGFADIAVMGGAATGSFVTNELVKHRRIAAMSGLPELPAATGEGTR